MMESFENLIQELNSVDGEEIPNWARVLINGFKTFFGIIKTIEEQKVEIEKLNSF